MNHRFILSLIFSVLLFAAMPARCENAALMELLKALYENGTIDASTYELVRWVAKTESDSSQKQLQQLAKEEMQKGTEKLLDKRIEVVKTELADRMPKVRVGGRIQTDVATYSEDSIRHNDGTELRRARLFAQGDLGEYWSYKLQYDFTNTGIDGIQDAYLDYKGLDIFKIRLGHFKEPFSLQNITSSKHITFIERGLPHVFAEGRNIGIQAGTNGSDWSATAGLFGEGRNGAESDNDEGWGLSARMTYTPLMEKDHVWHVGASVSYRQTGSEDSLRFRERPESHVTDTRIVDTGTIDADSYSRVVAETAILYGPFHLQGEYYHTFVDRDINTNPNLDFDGFYIEGGWFITGESLNYKGSSGSFSRVTPAAAVGDNGLGAWQLAARFSRLDLIDADINGGKADSFTIGLNWFATQNIRFSANYVNILDVEGGPHPNDEPDVFQLRTQVEF